MDVRYDTYCGLNCGACPVGLANEQGDEEGLKKLAEEWGVTRKEVSCTGCKTEGIAPYCSRCEMRKCAIEKGVEFCNECEDYPCKAITDFKGDKAPHHSAIFQNLREIKEKGIQTWLDDDVKRWSCPDCGTRFTWYNENCTKCGKSLFNCIHEEEKLTD